MSVFSGVNNVVDVRVRKSHIKILNSVRLYRYKGGKFLVREAGGEVNIHKGGGRRTPCVPPPWMKVRVHAVGKSQDR